MTATDLGDYLESGKGVELASIQRLVGEMTATDLGDYLDQLIYGTGELPLPGLLEAAGVEVVLRASSNLQDKGGKEANGDLPGADFGATLKAGEGGIAIQRLSEGGAAQSAGLSAGDVMIAIDGLRLDLGKFESKLKRARARDVWQVHAFRRDELHRFEVELQPAAADTFVLKARQPSSAQLRAWLQL